MDEAAIAAQLSQGLEDAEASQEAEPETTETLVAPEPDTASETDAEASSEETETADSEAHKTLTEQLSELEAERAKWKAERDSDRESIATDYLREYVAQNFGDRAGEVWKTLVQQLDPNAQSGTETRPTTNLDPEDPASAEILRLRKTVEATQHQIESLTKQQQDALVAQRATEIRNAYTKETEKHPILAEGPLADAARTRVYNLMRNGMELERAAPAVAKELSDWKDSLITGYVEAKKSDAKSAAPKPDSAGPPMPKGKKFSFSDDGEDMESFIAGQLQLE